MHVSLTRNGPPDQLVFQHVTAWIPFGLDPRFVITSYIIAIATVDQVKLVVVGVELTAAVEYVTLLVSILNSIRASKQEWALIALSQFFYFNQFEETWLRILRRIFAKLLVDVHDLNHWHGFLDNLVHRVSVVIGC